MSAKRRKKKEVAKFVKGGRTPACQIKGKRKSETSSIFKKGEDKVGSIPVLKKGHYEEVSKKKGKGCK